MTSCVVLGRPSLLSLGALKAINVRFKRILGCRFVPYAILVSLFILMFVCLAFCVLDQKERSSANSCICVHLAELCKPGSTMGFTLEHSVAEEENALLSEVQHIGLNGG